MTRIQAEYGQAMAEFVVMVAGCVLLMFVAVPVIAKLSDMAYKSQEMARYVAWERTVWYGTGNDHLGQSDKDYLPSQHDLSQITVVSPADRAKYRALDQITELPTRSTAEILNSAENRLLTFSQQTPEFAYEDLDAPNTRDQHAFWRWTSGGDDTAMYTPGSSTTQSSLSNRKAESVADLLMTGYNGMMGAVAGVVNILSFGGGDKDLLQIAHPRRNLYYSSVSIPVSLTGSQLGKTPLVGTTPLSMNARAAVLADAWVAQDELHLREKSDDFVLGTGIEDNPLWDIAKTAISILEPSFKNIDMAPVNTDPIPDAGVACNPRTGFCDFDD